MIAFDGMRLTAVRLLLCILALTLLAGCGPTRQWDEEVQLASGQTIKVHRKQQWERDHEMGASVGYVYREASIEITSRNSQASPAWKGNAELLLVLDIDSNNSEYFLITAPSDCSRYAELRAPQPPYIEYRLRNQKWIPVAWSGIAVGRQPNLLVRPLHSGETEAVTWQRISLRNGFLTFPYKVIMRAGGWPNCALAKDHMN